MKKFFCCCLLAVVASVTVSAQITDSLGKVCLVPAAGEGGFARYIDRRTSTKGYRMTFIAAPLIVGGAVMSVYDTDFRRLRNGYVKSFHHDYDDYLQYAPAAVMLGLKAFGVKGRSSWGRMLVSDAFSVGLMAAAVNSLKYSFRVMRPDGSTRNSFPSGHTATVFMTATMLHKEYGHRSPWYSIGAYTVATVTGVTRQLNNRHWMSDVMVGAGIGILATEFGYFLADLIFKDKGLHVGETQLVYDRFRRPSFLSFTVGVTTSPGSYLPYPGMRTSFKAGPTVGAQGAWFASPYVGVGGRFAVTNLEMTSMACRRTIIWRAARRLPAFTCPIRFPSGGWSGRNCSAGTDTINRVTRICRNWVIVAALCSRPASLPPTLPPGISGSASRPTTTWRRLLRRIPASGCIC